MVCISVDVQLGLFVALLRTSSYNLMSHLAPRLSKSSVSLLDDAIILPGFCVRHRCSLSDDHRINPSNRGLELSRSTCS